MKLQAQRAALSVLPDSWIGYSGLNLVIVEQEVWASPAFDPQPIIDWVAMGGMCLIVDAPPEGRERVRSSLAAQAPFYRPSAAGRRSSQ